MSNNLKADVLEFNLIEVFTYLISRAPQTGVDLTDFNELLNDLIYYGKKSRIVLRFEEEEEIAEYTTLFWLIQNNTSFTEILIIIDPNFLIPKTAILIGKTPDSNWEGGYVYIDEISKTENSQPLSRTELIEAVKAKMKK